MAESISDPVRNVVPRWRTFRAAADLGVLEETGRNAPAAPAASMDEILELRAVWQRRRDPLSAAELVDAALVRGAFGLATEAAESLLRADVDAPISRSLASHVLRGEDAGPADPLDLGVEERSKRIAAYRRRLRLVPRDAFLWVDLAREYSALGQNRPAERALKHALALAPAHRFVLRSASRFYLHVGEPAVAHDVVRRAPSTPRDPWLVAAELASADLADQGSRLLKTAGQMVESRSFSPLQISELASALATRELRHGTRRLARRLFRRALEEPTENSVAQAEWAARQVQDLDVPEDRLQVPRAYEAGAWAAYLHGRHSDAMAFSWKWLLDEPFAKRPAEFGAWIAGAVLEDFTESYRIAHYAVAANPTDIGLRLRCVFALASADRPAEAEEELNTVDHLLRVCPPETGIERIKIVQTADRGLIAFRRGQVEEGRRRYLEAFQAASDKDIHDLAILAAIYLAREELRAGFARSAHGILLKVRPNVPHLAEAGRPIYEKMVDRLIREAEARRGDLR